MPILDKDKCNSMIVDTIKDIGTQITKKDPNNKITKQINY